MLTDEKLMASVAAGDIQKLGVLFNRYHINVYDYYYRKNRNQMLSEDLTQNVFERIMKYKASYTESYPFKPWLFRIAKNVMMDHYRGKKIELDQNVEPHELNIGHNDIMMKYDEEEKSCKLNRALAGLNVQERELIQLAKLEKMKYTEVAQVLNMTESAVKVKVHRAIKKMKNHYCTNVSNEI